MPDISKINALAIGSVAKVDGLAKASILEIDGVTVTDPGINPTAPTSGFLFTYSGAAAAYSLRQLNNNAPYVLRVRRVTGTGNTGNDDEADVKFDTTLTNPAISLDSPVDNFSAGGSNATNLGQFLNATGYTDADSLTVVADAFVDTWYDLTGNQNHVEQATPSRQPQIFDSASPTDLITENGEPAVEFNGNELLVSATTETANNTVTAYIVATPTTTGTLGGQDTFGQYFGPAPPYDIWALEFYPGSELSASYSNGTSWSGSNFEHTYTQNNQLLFLAVYQTSNIIHSLDGSAITGSRSGSFNTSASPYFIGSWPNSIGAGNSFRGTLQEAVLWSSDKSSNRTSIESDINGFFGIF